MKKYFLPLLAIGPASQGKGVRAFLRCHTVQALTQEAVLVLLTLPPTTAVWNAIWLLLVPYGFADLPWNEQGEEDMREALAQACEIRSFCKFPPLAQTVIPALRCTAASLVDNYVFNTFAASHVALALRMTARTTELGAGVKDCGSVEAHRLREVMGTCPIAVLGMLGVPRPLLLRQVVDFLG